MAHLSGHALTPGAVDVVTSEAHKGETASDKEVGIMCAVPDIRLERSGAGK